MTLASDTNTCTSQKDASRPLTGVFQEQKQLKITFSKLTSEMGAVGSTSTCRMPDSEADSPNSACTAIRSLPLYATPSP